MKKLLLLCALSAVVSNIWTADRPELEEAYAHPNEDAWRQSLQMVVAWDIIEALKNAKPGLDMPELSPIVLNDLMSKRKSADELDLSEVVTWIDTVRDIAHSSIDYDTYARYAKPVLLRTKFPLYQKLP
jgi:hypothetical protein